MNPVTQFIEAARFLTRLPLPSPDQKSYKLSETFVMFPVVGIFIGGVSGVLLWAGTGAGLPPFLAAVIALGGTIVFTGGLHEDGLGDVADGFGGGKSREDKLAIMRDSRVGTYGVLCLVLSICARLGIFVGLTERMAPALIVCSLIAAAALSRGLMVGVVTFLPPARTDGLAAELSLPLMSSVVTYALALIITVAALAPVMSALGIIIAIMCGILAAGVLALLALRQIGGHTGDVAGATQQVAEISCLLGIVALA